MDQVLNVLSVAIKMAVSCVGSKGDMVDIKCHVRYCGNYVCHHYYYSHHHYMAVVMVLNSSPILVPFSFHVKLPIRKIAFGGGFRLALPQWSHLPTYLDPWTMAIERAIVRSDWSKSLDSQDRARHMGLGAGGPVTRSSESAGYTRIGCRILPERSVQYIAFCCLVPYPMCHICVMVVTCHGGR